MDRHYVLQASDQKELKEVYTSPRARLEVWKYYEYAVFRLKMADGSKRADFCRWSDWVRGFSLSIFGCAVKRTKDGIKAQGGPDAELLSELKRL